MTGVRGVNSLLQVIIPLALIRQLATLPLPSESVSKTEIRSKIHHLGAKTTKRMGQALYTITKDRKSS